MSNTDFKLVPPPFTPIDPADGFGSDAEVAAFLDDVQAFLDNPAISRGAQLTRFGLDNPGTAAAFLAEQAAGMAR